MAQEVPDRERAPTLVPVAACAPTRPQSPGLDATPAGFRFPFWLGSCSHSWPWQC